MISLVAVILFFCFSVAVYSSLDYKFTISMLISFIFFFIVIEICAIDQRNAIMHNQTIKIIKSELKNEK